MGQMIQSTVSKQWRK